MGGTQEQFAYSAAFDVDATPEQSARLASIMREVGVLD